ncbi:MAG: ABC transporter permease, partial [Kiritimatiellae bacterium]|nr:ABC transporter permease [Kiritimatiellia bacterium]
IREQALSAGEKSVDFGQLFIGLSFFLIVAALLLTGMLFVLSVEKRKEEIATLLSLGYTPHLIKRLLLAEGFVPAFFGALSGTVGGMIYTKVVLYALSSIWRGAVGTSSIQAFILPSTLFSGLIIGLTTAIICIWISLSKQIKQGIAELYSNVISEKNSQSKSYILNSILIAICGLSAIAIMFIVPADEGMSSAGAFFGAGSLLLIAGISFCKLLLRYLYHSTSLTQLSINSLSLRNISRQQKRSLTAIAILASGIFLVIAVAANKKDPTSANTTNSDGTGGFSLYGEFTVPLIADLNSPKAQKDFGLDAPNSYIQIHAKDGDDASCLNLNHISSPRVISIHPETLNSRKSFTFSKLLDGLDEESPWLSTLGNSFIRTNNIIPAVADMEVITWSLAKKIGDIISYTDDSGKELKLKLVGGLANSIFQGSIIIAENDFRKHFPSEGGTKILLIDSLTPISRADPKEVTLAFEDYGLELVSAKDRLAEFNTIQNTYLSIFLILGGLGIILGTVGLGIVVVRNIDDRRQELAIMRAVGYKQKELYQLLLREHIILLLAGVACGGISGFLAVLPAIVSAGGSVPYLLLTVIIMTIIANGILWISIATTTAIRGNLFDALRRE